MDTDFRTRIPQTLVALSLLMLLAFPVFLSGIQVYAVEETWSRTYGGSGYDPASTLQQTSDNGYLLAGSTDSFGTDNLDFWLLKTDSSGNVQWEKSYGTGGFGVLHFAQQTSDGGYFIGGYTTLESPDRHQLFFWVLKLDSNGDVEWEKRYGGNEDQIAYAGSQTSDGGFIVTGSSTSFGAEDGEVWVLKLASDGGIEWEKTYGGDGYDIAHSVIQTSDGGYIMAIESLSFSSTTDWLVLKLDIDGNIEWENAFGSDSYETPYSIQQTSDSGYVIAGETRRDGYNFWILKLDFEGNLEWEKGYGTELGEVAYSVRQTSDGGYVAAGTTNFEGSNTDLAILKLDADGNLEWQKAYGGPHQEGASAILQSSDGGYLVLGSTDSYGEGNLDFWVLKLDADGNIGDCASDIEHTIDGILSEIDSNILDTDVNVQDSAATVIDTQAFVANSSAVITEPCEQPIFFYTLDVSDGVVPLDAEVHAFTTTTDPLVDDVTFRWIKPGEDREVAREVTVPVATGHDMYNPDKQGDWTIEADFQNGQLIRKTLTVGFFVVPESPIGAIAMVIVSMGVLGGFLYVRARKSPTGL